MMMKSLSSKGSELRLRSSSLTGSQPSTIESFTTCISNSRLSHPNLKVPPPLRPILNPSYGRPTTPPPTAHAGANRPANHITALANAQAAPAVPAHKKVVANPGTYDGSPAKSHEWWSKIKIWIQVSMQGATDAEVHLDHYMAVAHTLAVAPAGHNLPAAWPTWGNLTAEIEGFFLPRNNREWAHAQLLRLRQGPCQRIDEFLAQFEALKVQSNCPDEYTWDLFKRAVLQKILEQVYLQAIARDTYPNLCNSVREMGRAQELFIINSQGSPRYYQGPYMTSSSSASGSGTPMDIGATNTHPQPHGKGLQ
ncbi:hypothetical protein SCLCIDRAFT_24138 [Scleroderma citrinum Foug A]|uniref:Retrotransposon gag domain-containing protein n=1 Tax=Scleroderma citrinum Foug A TaxID=1036808 RepID=A0A0C3E610_9AGAM|nr:hypothetical protein SCLCIDRAFT_24138 [Scleroderma citrinum Foug A]